MCGCVCVMCVGCVCRVLYVVCVCIVCVRGMCVCSMCMCMWRVCDGDMGRGALTSAPCLGKLTSGVRFTWRICLGLDPFSRRRYHWISLQTQRLWPCGPRSLRRTSVCNSVLTPLLSYFSEYTNSEIVYLEGNETKWHENKSKQHQVRQYQGQVRPRFARTCVRWRLRVASLR